jgi:hypothetical protein
VQIGFSCVSSDVIWWVFVETIVNLKVSCQPGSSGLTEQLSFFEKASVAGSWLVISLEIYCECLYEIVQTC